MNEGNGINQWYTFYESIYLKIHRHEYLISVWYDIEYDDGNWYWASNLNDWNGIFWKSNTEVNTFRQTEYICIINYYLIIFREMNEEAE